ncbi:MAG: hypothetical protein AM326_08845 [Candidatus Thorarchaeota archaeon SMTZ-45]|nr:MAG: hypothetical protein AM325_04680 [Candidatus Thorarchaeota archaeon SMTZ1-45]KXH75624.1 MAG: hypothetical protein AM326_08845 [Candidatus Thorarchaeota archaeon SMTZ-45]
MVSRGRLNFLILVCSILILLTAYHIGLVAIPLGMDTEVSLVVAIGALAVITLLGAFGRKRGMDEIATYKPGTIISSIFIGAIAIMVIIMLLLAGIHPPGMDPEVPFLFVIPPLALVIVLAVLIEEVTLGLKLDQSK